MSTKKTDFLLDWMYRNLPPEQITLRSYVALNWCNDKSVEEVLEDGELAADLPEELMMLWGIACVL
jgi:hypothetical protein